VDACVVIGAPLSTVDQVWKNEVMERVNANIPLLRRALEDEMIGIESELQFLKDMGMHPTGEREDAVKKMIELQDLIHARIHIVSHSQLEKMDKLGAFCAGRPMLFILDEAHNLNMKPVSRAFVDQQRTECMVHLHSSFFLYSIISSLAEKCLFLTATPIVNRISDVNAFIRCIDICNSTEERQRMIKLLTFFYKMAHGKDRFLCNDADIVESIAHMNHVMEYLRDDACNVETIREHCMRYFHVQKRDSSSYPKANYRIIRCGVDSFYDASFRSIAKEYETEYKNLVIAGKLRADFGAGKEASPEKSAAYIQEIRLGTAISSRLLSPSALEILSNSNIRITGGNRTVLYVAFDELKNLFRRKLREMFPGITVSVIDGSISSPERMLVAKLFNEVDPEVGHVLIIMPAGREGVNLKKVTNVVFANEVWTQSAYEQIVGRGVRYRSHHNLPLRERKVMVYNLYNDLSVKTIDAYMRGVRLHKKELCLCFEKAVTP